MFHRIDIARVLLEIREMTVAVFGWHSAVRLAIATPTHVILALGVKIWNRLLGLGAFASLASLDARSLQLAGETGHAFPE